MSGWDMRIAPGLSAWWRKNGCDSSIVILANAWSVEAIDEASKKKLNLAFERGKEEFLSKKEEEISKRKYRIALIPYSKSERIVLMKYIQDKLLCYYIYIYIYMKTEEY